MKELAPLCSKLKTYTLQMSGPLTLSVPLGNNQYRLILVQIKFKTGKRIILYRYLNFEFKVDSIGTLGKSYFFSLGFYGLI